MSEAADIAWMHRALQESRKAFGRSSPNPAVGAVIVRDGRCIGRGHTQKPGLAHAEIMAIRSLDRPENAQGATLFVTLEPCSTHGRTPPCVDAIIRSGFARVVVGAIDPNPAHAGGGLVLLKDAGIEVVSGILEKECREANAAFNHWIVTRRPLVIAKCALSLDGRITRPPSEGQWLTSAPARRRVHQLRAQVDAILVGAETVRQDDPQLTVRGPGKKLAERQPWRVIISKSGQLPRTAKVFTDEWKDRTLVFGDLAEGLRELGENGVTSALLEGGGKLLGSAFDQHLVQRIAFFYAPIFTGGNAPAVAGIGVAANDRALLLENIRYEKVGRDLFCEADLQKNE